MSGLQSSGDEFEIGWRWFTHLARPSRIAFAHAVGGFAGRCGQCDFCRLDSEADEQADDGEHDRSLAGARAARDKREAASRGIAYGIALRIGKRELFAPRQTRAIVEVGKRSGNLAI